MDAPDNTDVIYADNFKFNVLKTKIPLEILLFFKTLLIQDVTGVILRFWWEFFICNYIHKYVSSITFAARHIMDSHSKGHITVYRCLKCDNPEYNYICPYKLMGFSEVFYPSIPFALQCDYQEYINENIKRNNFTFKSMNYQVHKRIPMLKFQNMLGSKPLEWNHCEAMLIPYYRKHADSSFFVSQLKRKRQETDDLFVNKRVKLL